MPRLGMSKRKLRRSRPGTEGVLPFRVDPTPIDSAVTSFAGLPLVAETFRSLGLDASCHTQLGLKQRERGFTEAQMVESFALMLSGGGDRLDDFAQLREDPGLGELIGYQPPSPDAARRFLYAFHDEPIHAQRPLDPHRAWIPPESAPLISLGRVNDDLVNRYSQALPPKETARATLDHDATVIDSHKLEALPHYKGGRGYQPSYVVWAETGLVVADEFRDGNVPAGMQNLPIIKKAFAGLPAAVTERYFRADSACYDQTVLSWLRHEHIGFAISADISESLRAHIAALPKTAWKALNDDQEWAEVVFVPSGPALFEPAVILPDRYIALRWHPRQLALNETDGYRYWALVTNLDWKSEKILNWHREKAGTIEHVHDVLKNELGLGTMPCGRFGADAAWSRLNVITYNLLQVIKRVALPKAQRKARPKRLRYEIFRQAGIIIHHARTTFLRLAAAAERVQAFIDARFQLGGLPLAWQT